MVSYIIGGMQAKGIWEQDPEANIWAQDEWEYGVEKAPQWGTYTYKTIVLPVVLYGCEAWSLTLREECKLRVFENRILRRISGPKRNENKEWRRLHSEKHRRLFRLPKLFLVIFPVWALGTKSHVEEFHLKKGISEVKGEKKTGKVNRIRNGFHRIYI